MSRRRYATITASDKDRKCVEFVAYYEDTGPAQRYRCSLVAGDNLGAYLEWLRADYHGAEYWAPVAPGDDDRPRAALLASLLAERVTDPNTDADAVEAEDLRMKARKLSDELDRAVAYKGDDRGLLGVVAKRVALRLAQLARGDA